MIVHVDVGNDILHVMFLLIFTIMFVTSSLFSAPSLSWFCNTLLLVVVVPVSSTDAGTDAG